MTNNRFFWPTMLLIAFLGMGCIQGGNDDDDDTNATLTSTTDTPQVACEEDSNCIKIEVSADTQFVTQRALIDAVPGQIIELGEGTFEFTQSLTLTVDHVTLRGQGKDKTILTFKNQEVGSEGILVTANFFTVEDLAVEDTVGDGIKIEGGNGVTIRRIRMEWTRGAHEDNGLMGCIRCNLKIF